MRELPILFNTDMVQSEATCKQSLQVNGWDANPWVWAVGFERMEGYEL